MSSKQVWNLLTSFDHRYSFDSILNSEMRVLKTVGYKAMLKTPLLYIETLLEILGKYFLRSGLYSYY